MRIDVLADPEFYNIKLPVESTDGVKIVGMAVGRYVQWPKYSVLLEGQVSIYYLKYAIIYISNDQ